MTVRLLQVHLRTSLSTELSRTLVHGTATVADFDDEVPDPGFLHMQPPFF